MNLQLYRRFLESIPLEKYRDELKDVKWVEQDLYPELLPQESMFSLYWQEHKFLDFESWFEAFWQELHKDESKLSALRNFKAYYFDKHNDGWFKLGFKARMYRTWTAVLTQLDFCYMFDFICEKRQLNIKLECNAALDVKGIDARVGSVNLGIGKMTQRKEARGAQRNIFVVPYAVYDMGER